MVCSRCVGVKQQLRNRFCARDHVGESERSTSSLVTNELEPKSTTKNRKSAANKWLISCETTNRRVAELLNDRFDGNKLKMWAEIGMAIHPISDLWFRVARHWAAVQLIRSCLSLRSESLEKNRSKSISIIPRYFAASSMHLV